MLPLKVKGCEILSLCSASKVFEQGGEEEEVQRTQYNPGSHETRSQFRRYMAEILLIRRETPNNQSINTNTTIS